ncbi:MAG: site-2 protease family protein [Caulobacteraceae bacterium]|nr:site-2 protease family protein [Caulobacteraceae bacterium]
MLGFLTTAAFYVVPFLVIITVIVTVHELGHFLTARAFGVAVDRFSVGFGRALASFKDRWGVEWRIAWLPLGGYVKFAGDENVASVPDDEDLEGLRRRIVAREGVGAERRYFYFKPLWQRALVVAAGPIANFLLAIALFSLFFGAFGEAVAPTRIGLVVPGEAAARAGLQPGDLMTAADGRELSTFDDLRLYVQDRAGAPIRLTVRRGAQTLEVAVTPGERSVPDPLGGTMRIGYLGLAPQSVALRHYGPIAAVGRGARETWSVVEATGHYLRRLAEGKASWQFGGVIGGAHAAGAVTMQAVHASKAEHVNLALALVAEYSTLGALLSVSLGLLNLLPIPVLDGGHLLFYAYESVARRPITARVQAAGYRLGLALLVGLMLFTTWHDLQRLQVFHLLGALFS